MSLRVRVLLRVLVRLLVLCGHGAAAAKRNSTEPFLRLVDGASRCRGRLQVWRAGRGWTEVNPRPASRWFGYRLCEELDCGRGFKAKWKTVSFREAVFYEPSRCDGSSLIDCFGSHTLLSSNSLELNCSEVRLVGGQSQCSGSLQIQDLSLNLSWAGVCEGALDRRGAEVLCGELGCGAPLLQGALSPLGQTFHCEGHESMLMDCNRTRTGPETCPTLNLTCTESLRLVGGASRCEGTLEKDFRGEWRPVVPSDPSDPWDLEAAAAVCRELDCGSPVSVEERDGFEESEVWGVGTYCVKKRSAESDCEYRDRSSESRLQVVCSDLLNGVPEVSVSEGVWAPRAEGELWGPRAQEGEWASPGEGGAWVQMGAHFRVTCSVEPQYPGGSFQLLSPTLNLTLPAVNHSAHFLFTDVSPAHKGHYTCVYLLQVFDHSFTSNSSIYIHPGVSDLQTLVRALVLLLLMPLNLIPFFFYRQATRGRERAQRARRRRARPEEDEEERTDVAFVQM